MSSSLEERLKNNSSAFDGLLSLIPAKYYYDDDTQEQWKAKKKSKDEAKQIKRAKLDPSEIEESDKISSASQVLSKKAQTAKPVVIPGRKKVAPVEKEEGEESELVEEEQTQAPNQNGKLETKELNKQPKNTSDRGEEDEEEEDINIIFDDEGNEIELGIKSEPEVLSKQESKKVEKTPEEIEADKKKKQESINQLKEKLAAKISTMREKRRAPGTKAVGAPSSREAILAERRKKAELKAQQKIERKRKLAEMEKDDEDDADEDDDSDDSDVEKDDGLSADNVLFQNIQFDDSTKTTSDLSNLRKASKKKGPANKDLKGHLKLLEAKKEKQSLLDPEKLKELEEKEKWNRTIAQAEGIKVKDDEKLLKKALKRKEASKRKSEIQWQERKEHAQKMVSLKQKRREENLQIRKDNKGIKRKNQTKQKRKFKTSINPKRAGFEGKMKRK